MPNLFCLKRKISIWAIFLEQFVDMKLITENRGLFGDKACKLVQRQQIRKTEKNYDVSFNSFFKYGWKRFDLKWYTYQHPLVLDSCPRSFAILMKVRCIKVAMFAELLPKGKPNRHGDPFVGSLRYHLDPGQSTGEGLSNKIMSITVSPNRPASKTSFINRLSTIYY